jgi:hypothetical protein
MAFSRTFRIDRLDTDVLASALRERNSHRRMQRIKARTAIFASGTSDSASLTLACVVPKSLRGPQCFDFDSYFFV